jgi:hypothetical protein
MAYLLRWHLLEALLCHSALTATAALSGRPVKLMTAGSAATWKAHRAASVFEAGAIRGHCAAADLARPQTKWVTFRILPQFRHVRSCSHRDENRDRQIFSS